MRSCLHVFSKRACHYQNEVMNAMCVCVCVCVCACVRACVRASERVSVRARARACTRMYLPACLEDQARQRNNREDWSTQGTVALCKRNR